MIWVGRNTWAEFNDHLLAQRFDRAGSNDKSFKTLKWSRPPAGCLKVNTVGAWDKDSNEAGCGYIIRDSNAKVLLAAAIYFSCNSALLAELLAIRSALGCIYSTLDLMKLPIIVESDCLQALGPVFLEGK